ncbi:hypothetical protein SDC9_167785 [bioreactor metagenome]|uniref:Uncharacterized protein n=1 Tax=bioreactor metagenome TaxID=1076179 RepID=A0A645G2M7_9ZZZZ
MSGNGQRGIVKLLINVLVGYGIVVEFFSQVRPEGFQHGENDPSVGGHNGVTVKKVENTVGIGVVF